MLNLFLIKKENVMRKNLKRFMSIFLSTAMAVTIIPSHIYEVI